MWRRAEDEEEQEEEEEEEQEKGGKRREDERGKTMEEEWAREIVGDTLFDDNLAWRILNLAFASSRPRREAALVPFPPSSLIRASRGPLSLDRERCALDPRIKQNRVWPGPRVRGPS